MRVMKRLREVLLALPAWAWLVAFFVLPIATIIYFSFGYKPGIFGTHAEDILSLDRYGETLSSVFFPQFTNTLSIGVTGTLLCLVIGAPMAYWIAIKSPEKIRGILLAMVMLPFWTNFLVRTIGIQIIIAPQGLLSGALQGLGMIDGPLAILYTRAAVLIGVVYNYLPLMVLPLFVAFDRIGPSVREASQDLGAGRLATFLRVSVPLAKPGIVAGMLLVFIPLMGDYITATVLGGANGVMVGQLVASQFQTAQNWALGSAMAVVLIVVILASATVGALIIWLIGLPMRTRQRLTIGEAA